MSDLTPSKWAATSAAAGATPVDFDTRPCGICGERVRVTMHGGFAEYHDCKPVPGARLDEVKRERDEARLMVTHNLEAAQHAEARLERAVELLREAIPHITGGPEFNYLNNRIGSLLAGQPAPVPVKVDDAMVERACAAMWSGMWPHDCVNPDDQRNDMRAALVAALEGRT